MGLGDIGGIGQLKEALTVTNHHLELVLAELQETNRQRLEGVTSELRRVNEALQELLETGRTAPATPAS